MKLFFRVIFQMFFMLAIFIGCETTQEIKEDEVAYYNQGLAYVKKEQYNKAIAAFDKAIELNPRFAAAYVLRGGTYNVQMLLNWAISDFNKAIEIDPKIAPAYDGRALSYFFKREYDKAWDDVHKARNLGYNVSPEFLKARRQASGRQK